MGRKRTNDGLAAEQPAKKTKLLDKESEQEEGFTINEEYARRFEHNNKRKELQKCKRAYVWLVVL
jgi:protein KRI1